ncbi:MULTISPECIES: ribosome hibernation-promoting factor, HPF/YfiA family [unclassified Adlercreutzia]|uniref:ribosome hibernation-promoting factor, HPF/YfiA family n=1 Tax=unclassified Adlercreutzia TaxID=2636013 RepID=UPI0013EE186B|nr:MULTISPECIES: ribosome-associated translation inhibitor RaiA [unclassified Adlercreutzia]
MDIKVSGRKINVSDSTKEYAIEKIGGAVQQLDVNATACEIVLFREKNPAIKNAAICEVTVFIPNHVARAQVREEDLFAAIDVAAAKIARQLRKLKTRVNDKRREKRETEVVHDRESARAESELDLDKLMEELSDNEVVRRKEIEYSPKTEEEALTEIDLLGHDFYVYTDRDSGNVHVLYRRHDGGYGLLTPTE